MDEEIERYLTAYQEAQSAENNRQLVVALLNADLYTDALSYANEQPEAYITGENQQIYLNLLLHEANFVLAREFVLALPANQALMELVLAAEGDYELNFPQTLKQVSRAFYHLSEYALPEQNRRLQAALKLPFKDFVLGAKFNLLDPFGSQITRTSLLDHLRKLAVTSPIKFLWLDQKEHEIVPARLIEMEQETISQAIEVEIAALNDPLLSDNLKQVNQYLLINLYPYAKEVITDVQQWVRGVTADLQGESMFDEPELQRNMRQKILAELNTL
ncbi:TPR repeat-containing protein [Weissella oryzae SG25]|uniref:TPR repeat-containing protein n=1 Tax=Weissella oryzae (strain DSM 25784 / JCM 18191 / LMG 30913 / SG25) TaxID=1329250 RepID=A0A069CV93_WEIOS|nr:hypothetical protein [Weissella oryzae]GAK31272.1 TPR repeat-containing protein [Weissella oryzae SG25]